MTPTVLAEGQTEEALHAFLDRIQGDPVPLRTLTHAWLGAGGAVQVGHHVVRLMGRTRPPYTAATLYARSDDGPVLEVSRVLVQQRGVPDRAWADWCDEQADLQAHGFVGSDKYPRVRLARLGEAQVLRLAVGLRDLCLAVQQA